MFTGIVEEVGVVSSVVTKGHFKKLSIHAKTILKDLKIGDSISVNGICLTVINHGRNHFSVEVVTESLMLSNLETLRIGDKVNLERALSVVDRIGGHIVSGHVDGVGTLKGKIDKGTHFDFEIEFPQEFSRYFVKKGSIAIEGISLTVAEVDSDRIRVSVIPHTLKSTTLNEKRIGDKLNLELDILGKYVESLLIKDSRVQGVTEDMMSKVGFIPIGIVEN